MEHGTYFLALFLQSYIVLYTHVTTYFSKSQCLHNRYFLDYLEQGWEKASKYVDGWMVLVSAKTEV